MDTIPPEILAEIFQILTVTDRPSAPWRMKRKPVSWGATGTPSLGWINATYVCHYWRDCALRTPILWTYLSDIAHHGERWTEVFVERGKEVGICYEDKDVSTLRSSDPRYTVLSQHVHHISTLHLMHPLAAYANVANRIYQDMLLKPAPMLRDLSLQDFPIVEVQFRLPSLRRLRLWNTSLSLWPKQLFTLNLLSFEYCTRVTDRDSHPIDINLIFDALRETPDLRSLTLDLNRIQPFEPDLLPIVTLRSLVHIDISAEAKTVLAVVKHIVFPPTASLRIASREDRFAQASTNETTNLATLDFYEELTRNSEPPAFKLVNLFAKTDALYFAAARYRSSDISFIAPSYDLVLELPVPLAEPDLDSTNNVHGLAATIFGRFFEKESLRELHLAGAWCRTSIAMFYDMWRVEHMDLMGPAVELLVEHMTGRTKPRRSVEEKPLGDRVQTLALHRGHVDRDLCMRLAQSIGSPAFKKDGVLKTVYLSKANMPLLGRVWDEAGVEVVGV
ncbi:unnamed protein product [Peniophora sp. CBMAI 1063]|nr:unnamed protein product [Peniophora sp. CBMAI 1063]